MSETTSWTDHVLNRRAWMRFLFMLLFTPLLGCVGFMLLCVALFQFFSVLASGEDNTQLRALGADLSRLGVDIVAFLTYNTERKPFAFGNSRVDTAAPEAGADTKCTETQSEAQSPTPRKTATRKTTTRKKKSTTRKQATTDSGENGTSL